MHIKQILSKYYQLHIDEDDIILPDNLIEISKIGLFYPSIKLIIGNFNEIIPFKLNVIKKL